MSWYESLPPAEAPLPCGAEAHVVRWEAGRLELPAHPDAQAELVLAALGGTRPRCVQVAETWSRHADDLDVLMLGPRSPADEVSVGWRDAEDQRASWFGSSPQARLTPTRGTGGQRPGRSAGLIPSGAAAELTRLVQARVELLELLALGPAFQFRLAGAVAAAWSTGAADSGPRDGLAGQDASQRPALIAALAGRLAPAVHEWLGIAPDPVHVTLHDEAGPAWARVPPAHAPAAPAWGTLEVYADGTGRRLRASLPPGWLASVWACGLAVVGSHLVVAVEEPGWPRARVLALPSPDAAPISLSVTAAGEEHHGLPRWEVADT